jgi:hypothetical protein
MIMLTCAFIFGFLLDKSTVYCYFRKLAILGLFV